MAAKNTKAPTIDTLTAEQRATLEPLILRAALAAMAQSKAGAAYERWLRGAQCVGAESAGRLDRAQDETESAGAALAKALRTLRVPS